VYVNYTGDDGVHVNIANDDGFNVAFAADDGVSVDYAAGIGVSVLSAGAAGLWVRDAYQGLEVNTAENDGVLVVSAGRYGVLGASTAADGVYGQTDKASHEWGLNTPDKIHAMNVTMSSLSVVARNDGPAPLQAGDLVAVTGLDRPMLGGGTPMPNVRRADAHFTGVIGVVESHMVLTVVDPGEALAGRSKEGMKVETGHLIHEDAHSVEGDAAPGEYVSVVVYGITDVKVDATAGAIEPGQRLTGADLTGHARALRSKLLDGMTVNEGAPTVGLALAPLDKDTGTIPVFVTLR
jgi:hypothetical protein